MNNLNCTLHKLKKLINKWNINLTEFWKAVQSSWKTDELGVSSSLHFFLIDCSVLEKSDMYLEQAQLKQALSIVSNKVQKCFFYK